MQIWLARHGEAVSPDEAASDFDRRLNETGRRQVAQLGRWLRERVAPPDLILHSPLTRAGETAEILRAELGRAIPIGIEPLMAPGMRCEPLLAKLASGVEQTVLCVGHQPDIGRCLADTLGGGRFAIPPGTLAAIDFPHVITRGGGQLQWMLTPDWF